MFLGVGKKPTFIEEQCESWNFHTSVAWFFFFLCFCQMKEREEWEGTREETLLRPSDASFSWLAGPSSFPKGAQGSHVTGPLALGRLWPPQPAPRGFPASVLPLAQAFGRWQEFCLFWYQSQSIKEYSDVSSFLRQISFFRSVDPCLATAVVWLFVFPYHNL